MTSDDDTHAEDATKQTRRELLRTGAAGIGAAAVPFGLSGDASAKRGTTLQEGPDADKITRGDPILVTPGEETDITETNFGTKVTKSAGAGRNLQRYDLAQRRAESATKAHGLATQGGASFVGTVVELDSPPAGRDLEVVIDVSYSGQVKTYGSAFAEIEMAGAVVEEPAEPIPPKRHPTVIDRMGIVHPSMGTSFGDAETVSGRVINTGTGNNPAPFLVPAERLSEGKKLRIAVGLRTVAKVEYAAGSAKADAYDGRFLKLSSIQLHWNGGGNDGGDEGNDDGNDKYSELSRFDLNDNHRIDWDEVQNAISAFNGGDTVGGKPVEFETIQKLIRAYNQELHIP